MTSLLGYTNACSPRSGGVKAIYLAVAADVTSLTLTSGVWTAITMVSGKVFKKYEFEQDTAQLSFEDTIENGSYLQKASIEMFMPKLSAALTAALQEFVDETPCGMIAIVELNTKVGAVNEKYVIGYNNITQKERPLKLESNTGGTGKLLTDLNGYTPILVSTSPELFRTTDVEAPLT